MLEAFKESLVSELGNKTAFTIPVLGGIPVADSVVVSWIIMALLTVLSLVLTRKLSVRSPGRVQAALEWAVQFLNGFVKTNIGSRWRPFAPWLGTVALYIGLSNLIGIFGLTPPTKDISVTTALAVMSMLLIYGAQFRYNGLLGGLKKFAEPMPLLLPINLMEVVIRPLALCMRLFRQHPGRLHHHGDAQVRGAGGAARRVQHLLRPVRRPDPDRGLCVPHHALHRRGHQGRGVNPTEQRNLRRKLP